MVTNTPTALLFPGQGSQTREMRGLVEAVRPDLLEAVIDLVGEDPFSHVEESTRFAQPAIFCASLASWSRIADQVTPTAMAGHSQGELSALAAAGAVDEFTALELVVRRGALMAQAGRDSGDGTMLALIGGTPARAARLAARHRVFVANDNAPDVAVLSGQRVDIEAARSTARQDGLRVLASAVGGAFHSPHMSAAVEPFRVALSQVDFRPPRIPVLSCTSARTFTDPANELADALVAPVRWRDTMRALTELGANTFIDAGPGHTLARLAPRCVTGAAAATADLFLEMESAHVAA